MKLQQLRYIWEVAHNNLNVSATAQCLYTSQPGISKQIRLLEDELGVEIFARNGKHLTQITPAGEKILQLAGEVLHLVEGIKQQAQEFNEPDRGALNIAVTQNQAGHRLPEVLHSFGKQFPRVSLSVQQASPDRVAELLSEGTVDLALASSGLNASNELVLLPCYHWKLGIFVPTQHPLMEQNKITLEQLAEYPLITYAAGYAGHALIEKTFQEKNLNPRFVCTATDTDVMKTYVSAGMGVGLMASLAYHSQRDTDLTVLAADDIFKPCTAWLGLWRGGGLRQFTYKFIEQLAPHLTRDRVEELLAQQNSEQLDKMIKGLDVPVY